MVLYNKSTKSLSIVGKIDCISGSPGLVLISDINNSPSSVIITPRYRNPI
jgi:hypothetical protein